MVSWMRTMEFFLAGIILIANVLGLVHIAKIRIHREFALKLQPYTSLAVANLLVAAMNIIGNALSISSESSRHSNVYNSLPVICFALQSAILNLTLICVITFIKLQRYYFTRRFISNMKLRFLILLIWLAMVPSSFVILIALKRNHTQSLINNFHIAIGIIATIFTVCFVSVQSYLLFMYRNNDHSMRQQTTLIHIHPMMQRREDMIDLSISSLYVANFVFGLLPVATYGLLYRETTFVTNVLVMVKSIIDPCIYSAEVFMTKKVLSLEIRHFRYAMQEFSETSPERLIENDCSCSIGMFNTADAINTIIESDASTTEKCFDSTANQQQ